MANTETISVGEARMIGEAALFAAHAHRNQVRPGCRDPYINHLAEVAAMCAALNPLDPVLVTAAWLHDAVEDTAVTETTIRARFSDDVVALVMDVTDPPGLKEEARRERQVAHTAKAGDRTKLLKLADKTSNVEKHIGLPPERFNARANARYLDWSRRVVDVCRGHAPALEERFDAAAAALETRIEAALKREATA